MDIKTNSRVDIKKAIKKAGGSPESTINLNMMAKKALSEENDCKDGMYWCEKSEKCKPIKNKKETEEASGAGGAGGYVGPLFTTKKKSKKSEVGEATTSADAGIYSTAYFLAANKKNWKGGSKPSYKGGKIVTVKDKCKKFPYCNQGDINALNLTEAIDNVSNMTGKNVEYIGNLVDNQLNEMVSRGIFKSPVTDLTDKKGMNLPTGNIYSNK
tara:strand:+ start:181 stop:819 length:639 start_codon:yes stop_codon:yes gene_type:complete